MCCSDKQEQITSFIDGELSTRDQIELFKHLAACPDCHSFIDVMMRWRDIQKREQINYPVEIDETLLSRLGSLRRTLNSESPRTTPVRSTLLKHRVSLPVPLAIGAAAAAIITTINKIMPTGFLRFTCASPAVVLMLYTPESFLALTSLNFENITRHFGHSRDPSCNSYPQPGHFILPP